ncbi:Holliday junction branch migration protein RuvA [Paludibaculum fermentans]|uniref:Holliday junction branch migration complex subunit RuvA n=1 Tax=Paludibaculum fermentans TaxID=1473598 RepID=A0A7S7SK60_PALFE|nr:Holliday junction branch migration protein RuvA [Paludibaculum fermentans]QOY87141.1 Holliday junction branch migration protein RuvA [Paludibaculum fermentans]
MIAHLRGILIEKHPNQAIVEAGGVGYDVQISVSTYSALPEVGAEVKLRIFTNVREDAIQLFGFREAMEKSLFEKLISVSGIGPKLAITTLSGVAAPDLVRIIRAGEVAMLTRVPGIGKKTAERIVLELRDKMEGLGAAPAATAKGPAAVILSSEQSDVVSALVNLGCQQPAAEAAVRKAAAEPGISGFEPLFRRSMELLR